MGSPGIIIMSPHTAMSQPAPAATRTSRTLKVKPLGAPLAAGSLLRGQAGCGWGQVCEQELWTCGCV